MDKVDLEDESEEEEDEEEEGEQLNGTAEGAADDTGRAFTLIVVSL